MKEHKDNNGKTIRYIYPGNKMDTSLVVNKKNPNENLIEVLGHEFQSGLSYSLKKKQRWQLPKLLCNGAYDEENPIVYTKHQCVNGVWPIQDMFVYDSLSNCTYGSVNVTNLKLAKGPINIKSVINQLENGGDNQHPGDTLNKEDRNNCVYFSEYVHLTDVSKVNMIQPCSYRQGKRSSTKKMSKTVNLADHEYDDYDDECEEEIENTEYIADKPFIITGNDFLCQKSKIEKSKIQKGSSLTKTGNNDSEVVVSIYNDNLLTISINLLRLQFNDELQSIVSFCKCWKSSVNPVTILVDLDQYEETQEKSFILLRPSVQKYEDLISVKVLFNVANCGFNESELLDMNFDSLLKVVTFMQSRLRSGTGDKLLSLSNVVQLDGCMDEMRDVPRVARLDGVQYLYWHHSEWKNCEITIADVASIVGECDQLTYSAEECAICHSVVADDDDIVMMSECKHRICDECLRVSVCQRLDSISDHVTCPVTDDGNNCSTRLDAVTILSVVSWRHYLRRLTMVLERSIVCGRPCHQCGATILLPSSSSSSSGQTVTEYVCVCGTVANVE